MLAGFRPGPCWEAYSALPDSLAGVEGACCPVSKNPILVVGPSGLASFCSFFFLNMPASEQD